MNTLIKIGNFCERIMLMVAVGIMSFIPIAIITQVIFRSLNVSVNWSEEAARFAYVAVTFLGGILAVKHGKHIAITFLFDRLPRLAQRAFGIVIHLCMACFMAVCAYGNTLLMTASKNVTSNSIGWFYLNYIYGFVFVCCILMVIVCIIRSFEYAFDKVKLASDPTGGAI